MKRLGAVLLAAALVGCGAGQGQAPSALTAESGREAVVRFSEAKVARNLPAMQALVLPNLRDGLTVGTSNPHVFQYTVGASSEYNGRLGTGLAYPAAEFFRYTGEPYSLVRKPTHLAQDRNGQVLLIPDAQDGAAPSLEAAPGKSDPKELTITRDGKETRALISTAQVPDKFWPHGAAPDVEFGVGRDGWGALAVAPDLNQIAFVTRGTHPLLGIVDVAGKVKGLDLWYGGGAGELAWSLDGKYLAATVHRPSGVLELQVWDPAGGKKLTVTGLPTDTNVTDLRWKDGILYLMSGNEPWTYDPASGQAKRA